MKCFILNFFFFSFVLKKIMLFIVYNHRVKVDKTCLLIQEAIFTFAFLPPLQSETTEQNENRLKDFF